SITAKIGVIAAYFHRARCGEPLPTVRRDLSEAAHFLYLMTGKEPSKEASDALDVAFVLHADHGMNASTFSARVTISTLSDFYSAITSAIGTLKGPLHGGANEGVIQMLQEIGEEKNVDAYVEKQLAQKKKIMGIGHRVYKTLDPRAPHLRAMARKLSEKIGEPKWIRMSERIAQLMKEKKNLNANVDFYSATVYYSLGIPTDLFTPIFAIARCSGWCAQVLEPCRPRSDPGWRNGWKPILQFARLHRSLSSRLTCRIRFAARELCRLPVHRDANARTATGVIKKDEFLQWARLHLAIFAELQR